MEDLNDELHYNNCFTVQGLTIHIIYISAYTGCKYLNVMPENGYMSLINKSTRVNANSYSCIDHMFVKARCSLHCHIAIVYQNDLNKYRNFA